MYIWRKAYLLSRFWFRSRRARRRIYRGMFPEDRYMIWHSLFPFRWTTPDHIFINLVLFLRMVIRAPHQQVMRDSLSLWEHTSLWLLPRLRYLHQHHSGAPRDLVKSLGPDEAEAKWNEILSDMVFSFEWTLIARIRGDGSLAQLSEACRDRYGRGFVYFINYYLDLWE